MFRRLHPTPGHNVDPAREYAGTEYLRANMISSLDGAATVRGRVGGLTGDTDQKILTLLRELADVLLVGAGTIRGEGYGPIPGLPIAIVTDSVELDLSAFADVPEDERPWVITHRRAPVDTLPDFVRVITAGEGAVHLHSALGELRRAGYKKILTEGGPQLLGELINLNLVTEVCLTITPQFIGGEGKRIIDHPQLLREQRWKLAGLLEADGELFSRYVRR
ncbi:dihydrofolate reductase family protein [Enemella sp. A6]|uniref:dihydrofolate reductase family protein n=1 Tax=Enemella sp. A6 TaxID=3440152 RepID=UPI003EB905D7